MQMKLKWIVHANADINVSNSCLTHLKKKANKQCNIYFMYIQTTFLMHVKTDDLLVHPFPFLASGITFGQIKLPQMINFI